MELSYTRRNLRRQCAYMDNDHQGLITSKAGAHVANPNAVTDLGLKPLWYTRRLPLPTEP
jgi:hypothetical protein